MQEDREREIKREEELGGGMGGGLPPILVVLLGTMAFALFAVMSFASNNPGSNTAGWTFTAFFAIGISILIVMGLAGEGEEDNKESQDRKIDEKKFKLKFRSPYNVYIYLSIMADEEYNLDVLKKAWIKFVREYRLSKIRDKQEEAAEKEHFEYVRSLYKGEVIRLIKA